MTTCTFSGTNTSFLASAFFDGYGDVDIEVVSASSTQVVVTNLSTGYITTVTGSGFQFSGSSPTGGTITGIQFADGNGITQGSLTGISWGLVAFDNALEAASFDNLNPLADLFNSGGPITVDATGAGAGLDMYELLDGRFADLLTQPVTVRGSAFEDFVFGGRGNDTIVVGADNGGYYNNEVIATLGNDTIDFSGVSSSTYVWLDYENAISGAVTFNVNGANNTGTIVGAGFTDTLTDVRQIMEADGLGLVGSENNDVFNVTTSDFQWLDLIGNEGDDIFNLTLGATIRLSFTWGANGYPTTGMDINLATGIVNNDGHGGRDTINILGGTGMIEIRGTNLNDTMLGSDRNESFITQYGQDTVNGGGGFDRVRYDRSGIESVTVNLATQSATVIWDNSIFQDSLISIEHIRGSRMGNDEITGSAANERLEGLGGNDSLVGGNGNDTIYGGDNYDTIHGGGGRDVVYGDDGRDQVFLNQGHDIFHDNSQGGVNGQDTVFAGLGNDTIQGGNGNDVFHGQAGNDLIFGRLGDDLITGGGQYDTVHAGEGNDTVQGGDGRDLIYLNQGDDVFRDNGQGGVNGQDTVFAGLGDDTIQGGNGNDVFHGEAGNDLIYGRLGNDQILGGGQHDTVHAGAGNDTVFGGSGRDLVLLNQGDDVFRDNGQGGVNGQDTVYAGLGNDTIQGGNGNDRFFGQAGNDLIRARLGNDILGGGAGSDTLDGGAGSDTVTGGAGVDTFIFNANNAGTDTVTDFLLGTDQFHLGGTGTATVNYNSGDNEVTVMVGGDAVAVLQSTDDLSGFGTDDIVFI